MQFDCLGLETWVLLPTSGNTFSVPLRLTMCCAVLSLVQLCNPMDYSPAGSSVHGILQARILEWLPSSPPGDFTNPGIEHRSLVLQADSLPSEPPGKPKNTGVGNLSLLQGIFPTQELNQGLLHCRRILYQLSYQGSPNMYGNNSQSPDLSLLFQIWINISN